jgi:hypothetical protein
MYFINFYRKWAAVPQLNALAVAYEDLIEQQERTLAAAIGFITGDSRYRRRPERGAPASRSPTV